MILILMHTDYYLRLLRASERRSELQCDTTLYPYGPHHITIRHLRRYPLAAQSLYRRKLHKKHTGCLHLKLFPLRQTLFHLAG